MYSIDSYLQISVVNQLHHVQKIQFKRSLKFVWLIGSWLVAFPSYPTQPTTPGQWPGVAANERSARPLPTLVVVPRPGKMHERMSSLKSGEIPWVLEAEIRGPTPPPRMLARHHQDDMNHF